jgi:hypothetical protein
MRGCPRVFDDFSRGAHQHNVLVLLAAGRDGAPFFVLARSTDS